MIIGRCGRYDYGGDSKSKSDNLVYFRCLRRLYSPVEGRARQSDQNCPGYDNAPGAAGEHFDKRLSTAACIAPIGSHRCDKFTYPSRSHPFPDQNQKSDAGRERQQEVLSLSPTTHGPQEKPEAEEKYHLRFDRSRGEEYSG